MIQFDSAPSEEWYEACASLHKDPSFNYSMFIVTFIDSDNPLHPLWICFAGIYYYMADSIPEFLDQIYNHWEDDKFLCM